MNQLNLFWETWIDVVDYEGIYQVNGIGDVKSLNYNHTGKEKILKPRLEKNGYLRYTLCKNGKKEQLLAHRVVYEAFYEKIAAGMDIDHIDTNRQNNSIENLRSVTRKQNCNNPITKERVFEANKRKTQDQEWRKNVTEAARKSFSKPIIQLTKEGNFVKEWSSAAEVERELGFHHSNISACCAGKIKSAYGFCWMHLQEKEAV